MKYIYQRIVQLQCCAADNRQKSFLVTPTDLNSLLVIYLIYMVMKWRFSSSVTLRNLVVQTFTMVKLLHLMMPLACFFIVWDNHTWSFTNIERKSVGFEEIINSYQFPIVMIWQFLMPLSDAKPVVSSAKGTERWFEGLYLPLINKRKSTGLNTQLCGTHA